MTNWLMLENQVTELRLLAGIYRALSVRVGPTQRTVKSLFKTYIDCLHMKKSDKARMLGRSRRKLRIPWVEIQKRFFLMKRRNSLYLLVIFVGFLLFKALWIQLDTSTEFRNGAVSVKLCSNCLLFLSYLIYLVRQGKS